MCLCFSDHVPLVEQNFVKINRKGLSKMISDCFNLYYQYLSMVLIFFSECCIYFLFILLIFQNMLSSKTSPYLYLNDIVKSFCFVFFQKYHLNFQVFIITIIFNYFIWIKTKSSVSTFLSLLLLLMMLFLKDTFLIYRPIILDVPMSHFRDFKNSSPQVPKGS